MERGHSREVSGKYIHYPTQPGQHSCFFLARIMDLCGGALFAFCVGNVAKPYPELGFCFLDFISCCPWPHEVTWQMIRNIGS